MKKLLNAFLGFSILFNSIVRADEVRDPFTGEIVQFHEGVSDEEFNQGKKELLKRGINTDLVDKLPREFIPSYSGRDDELPILEKMVEVHNLFGSQMKPYKLGEYIQTVRGIDPVQLENLKELKKLNIDLFNIGNLDFYSRLLKKGISVEVLSKFNSDDLFYNGLELDIYSLSDDIFINCSTSCEEESKKIAESVKGFESGNKYARDYIQSKISSREKSKPSNFKITDGLIDLDEINDPHILFLIKGYVDYFSKPENIRGIKGLFRKVNDDYKIERMGVVFGSMEEYRILPLDMDDLSSKIPFNGYCSEVHIKPPGILKFVKKVGVFHTHPYSERYDYLSSNHPSGNPLMPETGTDFYMLKLTNFFNRYDVDCLISELPDGRINIDLFGKDVIIEDGEVKNSEKPFVIDLGVYSFD